VLSLGARLLTTAATEHGETSGGYAREQSDAYLRAEQAAIAGHLPQADVVICSAQVFGKRAPVLITAEMVARLRPGAVVVDLAADQAGNCAVTQPGREVDVDGVIVVGAGNLAALVPADASRLYAHTIVSFFRYLHPAHGAPPELADEIVGAACVTRDGVIVSDVPRAALPQGASA
jgi:proton-translocating NAD(P)+ transhydrogenase subunit alpha